MRKVSAIAMTFVSMSIAAACDVVDDASETGTTVEETLVEGAPLDVYLIAGQSNAVGGAQVTSLSTLNAGFATSFDAVRFAQEINCPKDGSVGACQLSRSWRSLAPRGSSMGIELSAGRRLYERFGGTVALLKHATNGSNLVAQWDSTGNARSLWTYMNDFVDARMAELPPGSRIAGLFWIQGNGDAQLATAAEDYAENLAWFIMRLRQDRGCVPVVIDRLHPAVQYPFADVVRAEQEQVASFVDDVAIVDTADLRLRDDPPQHYTADSFVTLGRRMADAMPRCQ
jgi:hypothetical protein